MRCAGEYHTFTIWLRFPPCVWFDLICCVGMLICQCLNAQVDKILGKTAPPTFINQLRELALKHHDLISVDVIRAYHFGQRYLVMI